MRARRGPRPTPAEAAPAPTDWLQVVTQVVGLFAGLATLVYAAGAIVITGRLALMNIPGDPVVASLPRDFVLSTGAGQVIIPALVVGALYALFRLLRDKRSRPRAIHRWRHGRATRAKVAFVYLATFVAMLLPALVVWHLGGAEDPDLDLALPVLAVLAIVAIAWSESRAVAARRLTKRARQWNSTRSAAIMAGLYALGAVPAMALAAVMIPLDQAKICTASGFEERGYLVGRSNDSVYIGETSPGERRLAILPASGAEELFVGENARDARCDFESARFAVLATKHADRVWEAEEDARVAAAAMRRATADMAFAGRVEDVVAASRSAAASMRAIADAAVGMNSSFGAPAGKRAEMASSLATDLEARLAEFEASGGVRQRRRLEADIRTFVNRLGIAIEDFGEVAGETAGELLAVAEERQPG
ncbi:MAG TPA: hypothetical protein VFX85_12290 [Solirubrobacterales bacterium]|nr:hypothetical protein [Solirubrobacterales bacterium]